jgi:hypothetical protein
VTEDIAVVVRDVSCWGLSPRGKPLDVPSPANSLPAAVKGRLQRLAYACAYVADLRGWPSAHACPHKECLAWPYRTGRWPEAEGARREGTAPLVKHLDAILGGEPGGARLDCYAKPDLGCLILRDFGHLRKPKTRIEGEVDPPHPPPPKPAVSVTKCLGCGVDFVPARRSARYCSTRCRMRAHRRARWAKKEAGHA